MKVADRSTRTWPRPGKFEYFPSVELSWYYLMNSPHRPLSVQVVVLLDERPENRNAPIIRIGDEHDLNGPINPEPVGAKALSSI